MHEFKPNLACDIVMCYGWALGLASTVDSIPPLNLDELKEEKGVQFAAEVTNRFTSLEASQDEATPEDFWKGETILRLSCWK